MSPATFGRWQIRSVNGFVGRAFDDGRQQHTERVSARVPTECGIRQSADKCRS
jgi:hypothetical protein